MTAPLNTICPACAVTHYKRRQPVYLAKAGDELLHLALNWKQTLCKVPRVDTPTGLRTPTGKG